MSKYLMAKKIAKKVQEDNKECIKILASIVNNNLIPDIKGDLSKTIKILDNSYEWLDTITSEDK